MCLKLDPGIHIEVCTWFVFLKPGVTDAAPECSSKALGCGIVGLMDDAGTPFSSRSRSTTSLQTTTIPTPHNQFKPSMQAKHDKKSKVQQRNLHCGHAHLCGPRKLKMKTRYLCSFWILDQHMLSCSRLGG
jgi:hypothetical protein